MFLREFGIILREYFYGITDILRLLLRLQLQKQAFLQIPRPYPRRLEFLDDLQHPLHLLFIRSYPGLERHVVHKAFKIPPQISVIIKASYYE